jgi:hypothetical protein
MRDAGTILIVVAALGQIHLAQTLVERDERFGEPSAKSDRSSVAPSAYIAYVQSDRKWRYGFRSEPYDKISEYFQAKLAEALEEKGIERRSSVRASSRSVVLEILDVSIHPAFVKKPGMNVSATVTILDADHHPVYLKGFRGESKTVMNTYGHLINHAIEDMVRNVVADEDVMNAVVRGTL